MHPDKNGGDEEAGNAFKLVSSAAAVLEDSQQRKQYDSQRSFSQFTGGSASSSTFDPFEELFRGMSNGAGSTYTFNFGGTPEQEEAEEFLFGNPFFAHMMRGQFGPNIHEMMQQRMREARRHQQRHHRQSHTPHRHHHHRANIIDGEELFRQVLRWMAITLLISLFIQALLSYLFSFSK